MPTDPKQVLASYQEAVASAVTDHARHMSELARAFLLDMQDAGGSSALDLQALLDELIQVEDQLNDLDAKADEIATSADEAYNAADGVNDEVSNLASTVRDMESNAEEAVSACTIVRDRAGDVVSEARDAGSTIESLIHRVRKAMAPALDTVSAGGAHVST